jgi:hypothetical protein
MYLKSCYNIVNTYKMKSLNTEHDTNSEIICRDVNK